MRKRTFFSKAAFSSVFTGLSLALFQLSSAPSKSFLEARPVENEATAYQEEPVKFFDPSHQKAITLQDKDLSIRLKIDPGKLGVVVQRKGAKSELISLPAEMAQVNDILRGPPSRAGIIGMVNGDAWEVAVLDLAASVISDKFLAYIPTASPDGRYVAFVKFFPTHFVQGIEHHYMLYDLAETAVQNRPHGIGAKNKATVGRCVYPKGIGNREGDNTSIVPEEAHIIAADSFFWRQDSLLYVFADTYQNSLALVIVRVTERSRQPILGRIEIAKNEMCAAVHKQDCVIRLSSVDFARDEAEGIRVQFRGVDTSLERELHFRYEQFKSLD
jgi:hypothetical protein